MGGLQAGSRRICAVARGTERRIDRRETAGFHCGEPGCWGGWAKGKDSGQLCVSEVPEFGGGGWCWRVVLAEWLCLGW